MQKLHPNCYRDWSPRAKNDTSALHVALHDPRYGRGEKKCHFAKLWSPYQLDRLRSEMISDGIRLTPQWSGHPPSELEFSVFNLRFIFIIKFMGVPPPGLVGGTWANKVRRRDLWISPEMCRGYPDAKWRAKRYKEREKIRRVEEKGQEERKCRCAKGRKAAKHCFPLIWGFGRSKSRLAKTAGAEPAGHMTDTPAVRSTFTPYQF